VDEQSAKSVYKRFKTYNNSEVKLLDDIIIKSFPDTYLKYLENLSQN
jgi:hypothetical protein